MNFRDKGRLRDLSRKPVDPSRSSFSPTASPTPELSSHSPHSSRSNSFDASKPPKRERRSKDHSNQRNYICGCGKSYLSYAALYTHAKTKHDGVFPEGTTTLHKKKQGRPKKDEWCATKINSEYQKFYDFNKEFQHFLDMIPGAREEREDSQKTLADSFPCEIFTSSEFYEPILLNLEQICRELVASHGNNFLTQIDIIVFEINNGKRLNCNEIFALFLIYVFRFVSKGFYRELAFFTVAYRLVMNKRGWSKYREMNDGFNVNTSKEFCEEQGAELLPDFSNELVNACFASYIGGHDVLVDPACLHFLGLDAIKLIRLILLIKHFCNWLNIHRFTKAKIEIKKD